LVGPAATNDWAGLFFVIGASTAAETGAGAVFEAVTNAGAAFVTLATGAGAATGLVCVVVLALAIGLGVGLAGTGAGFAVGDLAFVSAALTADFFATGFDAGAFFLGADLGGEAFLTGFFGNDFLAGALLTFFFGTGLEAGFLAAADFLDLLAIGLALPWAAFFLVGLVLLTV